MYPQPLVPPDLASLTERADRGWVRSIRQGRSSIEQVLARGLAEMQAEDEAEAYRADPVRYYRLHGRRRNLLQRLLRGPAR